MQDTNINKDTDYIHSYFRPCFSIQSEAMALELQHTTVRIILPDIWALFNGVLIDQVLFG